MFTTLTIALALVGQIVAPQQMHNGTASSARDGRASMTVRTWTDASGMYHSAAELADFQGGVAYLRKNDGKITPVPFTKLSKADQQFIESATPAVKVIAGKVVSIADGDTVTVLDGTTPTKIRLEGIDAPESHQAFGTKSRESIAQKVFQKTVRVEWREHDKYHRTLGHIFVDDRWVNKEMVQEGWAWHYRQYSKSEVLADAESGARTAKVGLWVDPNPIPPWEFRHPNAASQLAEIPATASPPAKTITAPVDAKPATKLPTPGSQEEKEETVYVTKTGVKYHRASCHHLKSSIPMTLSEAAKRCSPCSVCHPPVPKEKRASTTTATEVQANITPPVEYQARATSAYVAASPRSGGGTVQVKGYTRKDGTYVRPYTCRSPSR